MGCALMDISTLKDIIISGAAIVGATVAWKGLTAWKDQLTFRTDYELSRRLLISVFKYRDEVDRVRNSFMWSAERLRPTLEDAEGMSPEQIDYYGLSNAYQTRWSKIQGIRSEMYADILESEVLWGTGLKDVFLPILDLERELHTNIRRFLEINNPDVSSAQKAVLSRRLNENREVMYSDLDEEPDAFRQELETAISGMEAYLKPKLNR